MFLSRPVLFSLPASNGPHLIISREMRARFTLVFALPMLPRLMHVLVPSLPCFDNFSMPLH